MLKLPRSARFAATAVVLSVALSALLITAGCSKGKPVAAKSTGSTETSAPVGKNMAGPSQTVVISKQAVAAKPRPWVLTDPQSAVRSYLDWTSYAYRITESSVATPTMSAEQEVHMDSYIQYNLQKSQILDQELTNITFRSPSVEGTKTLLPATERWSYRYVSINEVGKTLAGPYTASYDTTYTVVKNQAGAWVVDTVEVKPIGTVK